MLDTANELKEKFEKAESLLQSLVETFKQLRENLQDKKEENSQQKQMQEVQLVQETLQIARTSEPDMMQNILKTLTENHPCCRSFLEYAICLARFGATQEALNYLTRVEQEFPKDVAAQLAEGRITEIRQFIEMHESFMWDVGEFVRKE